MSRIHILITMGCALIPAGLMRGQFDVPQAESFLAQAGAEKQAAEDVLYQKGQSAIDARHWDEAVKDFSKAAGENGPHADGALYWKAYALNKLGRRGEALTAIAQLRRSHSGSRWLEDAKALELEMRQASGQKVSPDAEPDEDLKLMALNGLMNSDPERALPMLEKFINGTHSPKLKERALFVLAQSSSPQARALLAQIARGGNPDLQMKAITYLGMMGSKDNRQLLTELYTSSHDLDVKRAVLRAFMMSGDRGRLLQLAKTEKNPELRTDAIRQLAMSGGQAELWQLYQSEPSLEVKESILNSMFLGGNSEKLIELARTEKDARLRKAAIHSLGLMGGEKTSAALVAMYHSESDASLRDDIINALFLQGDAKALVNLARQETNAERKKAIVSKLALMGSKESTDYLMGLLNQ
jgi:HEAT repeat protein